MQVLIILLLIIILVILVTFKNYVTDHFRNLESELQRLKKILPPATIEPPKVVATDVKEDKHKKVEEDYWQSSFKRVDEPVTSTLEHTTNPQYVCRAVTFVTFQLKCSRVAHRQGCLIETFRFFSNISHNRLKTSDRCMPI